MVFTRLEAFIVRLARYDGSDDAIEGLAGMAINRPVHDWSDADVDRAMVELADMARRFVHVEAFARVKGRKPRRHAVAVVVGFDGQPNPIHDEFEIADRDLESVASVMESMDAVLRQNGESRREIVLAALAELSARYLRAETAPAPLAHRQANIESTTMSEAAEWHVLGLSGGRDSAALAVHMRQNHPALDVDYFFTDTGKELPEVYEFLGKLEGFLGKPILRAQSGSGFRLLAPAVQQLPALGAVALVHPAVEAAPVRALGPSCVAERHKGLQLRSDPPG